MINHAIFMPIATIAGISIMLEARFQGIAKFFLIFVKLFGDLVRLYRCKNILK
jgi:hypothetical protein